MPTYNFKVRDKFGNENIGVIEAASRTAAADNLIEKGFFITKLIDIKKSSLNNLFSFIFHIPLKTIMVFSNQFSVMINAGLPIVESLKTLVEGEKNKKFSEILQVVATDVENGDSLSSAMSKYPDVFPFIYISMVKVGETSGTIDQVLLRVSNQLEKDYEIRTKLKAAMIYPAFILSALVGVAFFVVVSIIPNLKSILEESGTKLPWMTQVLMAISEFVINWWWLLIPSIVFSFIFLGVWFKKTTRGSFIWDYIKIKLPIVGSIMNRAYMAWFTRTFTTLAGSGVNVIKSLEVTADSIDNIHYKKDIIKIANKIKDGESLFDAFKESNIFSPLVVKMVGVGEKTGTLDSTVSKVADYYEREVNVVVDNLTKLLEPLIIICLGIGVGFLVIAVFIPIYEVTKSIQ